VSTASLVTQEHIDAFRARQARARARADRAATRARAYLPDLVHILTERYGATRVVLFGSLVRGGFRDDSDIDVAVEGVAPGRFFHALAEVNHDAPAWVDLKPLEDLDARFRARAFRTAEVLYGDPIE
jgi:predicted nucleotidyltransferase